MSWLKYASPFTKGVYKKLGHLAEEFEDELGNIPKDLYGDVEEGIELLEGVGESAVADIGLAAEPLEASAAEAAAAMGGPLAVLGGIVAGGAFLAYEEWRHGKRHRPPSHLEDHTLDDGPGTSHGASKRRALNIYHRATRLRTTKHLPMRRL